MSPRSSGCSPTKRSWRCRRCRCGTGAVATTACSCAGYSRCAGPAGACGSSLPTGSPRSPRTRRSPAAGTGCTRSRSSRSPAAGSRAPSCSPTRTCSGRSIFPGRSLPAISAGRDEPGRCRRYVRVSTDRRRPIVSVIVIQFITLDGIVSDPDGSGGTPAGGWAFRHGPETVAGDKFRLGSVLDGGVMLLGRRTWQLFSRLWPGRDDPFSARMNAVPKLVASRTLADVSAWANSRVIDGDLVDAVKREQRDVIITGSLSVVHALMAGDLIDEYRLLTFPTILGTGERLFPAGGAPAYLECLSAERAGAAVLARYRRAAR